MACLNTEAGAKTRASGKTKIRPPLTLAVTICVDSTLRIATEVKVGIPSSDSIKVELIRSEQL